MYDNCLNIWGLNVWQPSPVYDNCLAKMYGNFIPYMNIPTSMATLTPVRQLSNLYADSPPVQFHPEAAIEGSWLAHQSNSWLRQAEGK